MCAKYSPHINKAVDQHALNVKAQISGAMAINKDSRYICVKIVDTNIRQSSGSLISWLKKPELLHNFTLNQWDKFTVYAENGRLRIDNNLIENSICHVALGSKNYMFARTHDAAQWAAMMYSFFASRRINGVEPFNWLKETMTIIADHQANRLDELLPGAVKQ